MPPAGEGEVQQTVPGYVDCELDREGKQVVVCVSAVAQIDIERIDLDQAEQVTLLYGSGEVRALGSEHSQVFLLKLGLRQPDTTRAVPHTESPFDRH